MMRLVGRVVLVLLILDFFCIALLSNTNSYFRWGDRQYAYLAQSFLAGKMYFLEKPGSWEDCVLAGGKYYWPLGPLPALLLTVPVKIHGTVLAQGLMQLGMLFGVFFLAYMIARKSGYSVWYGMMLAFVFCFASVYHLAAFVPWSWDLANSLTVLLVMLAIGETMTSGRYWVVGILMSLVWTTRFTAGLGLVFFILGVIWKNEDLKERLIKIFWLIFPSLIMGLVLLWYNQIRFGNMWENGYKIANASMMNETQRYEQINYGLFKLKNIPTNFYYYFLKGLDPVTVEHQSLIGNTYILRPPYIKISYPGASFWIVAPVFIFIFRSKFSERRVKFAGITSLIILGVLLTYYYPGWRQTGPRYMMDLLPFWYLMLLESFPGRRLPSGVQLLIVGSAVFNLLLLEQVIRV